MIEAPGVDPFSHPDEASSQDMYGSGFTYSFDVLDEVFTLLGEAEGLYEHMADDAGVEIGHDPDLVPGLDEMLQAVEALRAAFKALKGL